MNTMQQEFDAVVAHLYKQGEPARNGDSDGPGCYYRAPGTTLMCAVGCRIPDAVYVPEMDVAPDNDQGTGLTNLLKRFGPALPIELRMYSNMFRDLQDVHDGACLDGNDKFDMESLGKQLASVAKSHKLTFTIPQGV